MKTLLLIFAFIGLMTTIYGIVGAIVDIKSFDQTKGGYSYPYEGWTGDPVNWNDMQITDSGVVKHGYVIDVLIDGTSGMISFRILGKTFEWRTFSDRALIVHKPREAFTHMGFQPEF